MHLFHPSLEENIVLGTEYIRASLRSGKSLDFICADVSTKHFGQVSRLFRRATRSGKPIRVALKEISETKIHPYLKDLVTALLSDFQTFQRLSYHLSLTVLNERKIELEDLTKKIDLIANWLVLLPLLPIAVLLMDLINNTLVDIPPEAGLPLGTLFSQPLKIGILAIGAFVITLVVMTLKIRIK